MAEQSTLFKDVFFKANFFDELSAALGEVLPSFNKKKFINTILNKEWENKELKQRTRQVTVALKDVLPDDFPKAAKVLISIANELKRTVTKDVSFGYICLAEYIELYGVEHFKESVAAMEQVTQFMSCEFAVRPFIIKYKERMMKQMLKWSQHKNAKVRRLASEGCRPRLPWGIALTDFKNDPTLILPILECLKADDDVWVRKSVANNLNDISKDNPDIAKDVFKKWIGDNKDTDWVVKHAARTLLKKGDKEVMALFGFKEDKTIKFLDYRIDTPKVKNGKELQFSFTIHNNSKQKKVIRLEYCMYYLKANGTHTKKVFKISEREYVPQERYDVVRKQSFKPITTRKYYLGEHKVSVIINGIEQEVKSFELI